jgi:hypothetical protein
MQLPAPVNALYVPAVQLVHADTPTVALHVPGGHAVQLPTPVTALYVPAVQLVHADTPTVALHVPVVQLVHTAAPNALYVPAAQLVHVLVAFAPTAALHVPGAQAVQLYTPVTALYVPTSHAIHLVPSAPVYPAMQEQFVSRGLLALERVLLGHAVHFTAAADE